MSFFLLEGGSLLSLEGIPQTGIASAEEFLIRFPEFCMFSTELINAVLLECELVYCPDTAWLDPVRQKLGVMLRTAHYFEVKRLQMAVTAAAGASIESGTTPTITAIDDDLGTTTYGRQFKELRRLLPVTGFAF